MKNNLQTHDDAKITFGEAATHWLKLKSISIKPSTYAKYYNILQKYLFPNVGNVPIEDIKTWDIEFLITELLKNGRSDGTGGLSVTTVRSILSVVRAILKYAEEAYIHPAEQVRFISNQRSPPLRSYLLKCKIVWNDI